MVHNLLSTGYKNLKPGIDNSGYTVQQIRALNYMYAEPKTFDVKNQLVVSIQPVIFKLLFTIVWELLLFTPTCM